MPWRCNQILPSKLHLLPLVLGNVILRGQLVLFQATWEITNQSDNTRFSYCWYLETVSWHLRLSLLKGRCYIKASCYVIGPLKFVMRMCIVRHVNWECVGVVCLFFFVIRFRFLVKTKSIKLIISLLLCHCILISSLRQILLEILRFIQTYIHLLGQMSLTKRGHGALKVPMKTRHYFYW